MTDWKLIEKRVVHFSINCTKNIFTVLENHLKKSHFK